MHIPYEQALPWIPLIARRIHDLSPLDAQRFMAVATRDLEERAAAWHAMRERWAALRSELTEDQQAALDRCTALRNEEHVRLCQSLDLLGQALAQGSTVKAASALQSWTQSHERWNRFVDGLERLAARVDDATRLIYGTYRRPLHAVEFRAA